MRRQIAGWFLLAHLTIAPVLFAPQVLAQSPAPAQPPAQTQDTPQDPLGRMTPRGAVLGFIKASQAGDYERAAEFFAAFPRSAKRGILEWIANAKTAATRAKRIDETARLAAENKRANQWRG